MRVVIRGGSISAGYGVRQGYVDFLRDRWGDAEILNRSGHRDTTFSGIRTYYEDIDPFRPEILMLHFGMDDAYQAVYRSEFKENLIQIIRLARMRFNPDIVLLTSHPFENQHEMDMICGYYRVIREVAEDLSCSWIPVHAFWMGSIQEEGSSLNRYLQDDCRYPNEKGHELYARAVWNRVRCRAKD